VAHVAHGILELGLIRRFDILVGSISRLSTFPSPVVPASPDRRVRGGGAFPTSLWNCGVPYTALSPGAVGRWLARGTDRQFRPISANRRATSARCVAPVLLFIAKELRRAAHDVFS
jgi:hypothetical protein